MSVRRWRAGLTDVGENLVDDCGVGDICKPTATRLSASAAVVAGRGIDQGFEPLGLLDCEIFVRTSQHYRQECGESPHCQHRGHEHEMIN